MVAPIEKAIQSANIGVNPNYAGDSVKLIFSTNGQRTEDRRLAKGAKRLMGGKRVKGKPI